MYDDESAWHNKFYKEVTSKVDEDIFKPLYTTEREDNRVGRPNASIRILVSMMILKEGCGCSDEQLYEQCRFNLLYRRALGMVTLDEQCPAIDSYYGFRRKICEYEEQKGVNLFDKCFKQITKAQAIEYRISGKAIRMDSKLISSNIAWYSRYEIIHATFVKCVSEESLSRIDDQLVRRSLADLRTGDVPSSDIHALIERRRTIPSRTKGVIVKKSTVARQKQIISSMFAGRLAYLTQAQSFHKKSL